MKLLKRRTFSRSAFILKDNDAFTLIELLTVIAIISVLAALLFPIFRIVKGASRNAVCQSNEKQLITAIHLYLDDYDEYFPQVEFKYGIPGSFGVTVDREKYEEQERANPKSIHNLLQLYLKTQKVFICPSDTGYVLPQDIEQDFDQRERPVKQHGALENPRYLVPIGERFGSSYRPAAELGDLDFQLNLSDIKEPAKIFYFGDFAGFWHTKYNRSAGIPDDPSAGLGDFKKWKQNIAYLDGHVKVQNFETEVWNPYLETLYTIYYSR
jgi:prepilin-type N-terminal cleavage/methylation domain-containing protein